MEARWCSLPARGGAPVASVVDLPMLLLGIQPLPATDKATYRVVTVDTLVLVLVLMVEELLPAELHTDAAMDERACKRDPDSFANS